jgi:hypothetical protein
MTRADAVGSTLFQNGAKKPYPCVMRMSERRQKRKKIQMGKRNNYKRRKQKPSQVNGRQGNK